MYRLGLLDIKNNFLATEKISKKTLNYQLVKTFLKEIQNQYTRNSNNNRFQTILQKYNRQIKRQTSIRHIPLQKRNKYMDKKIT